MSCAVGDEEFDLKGFGIRGLEVKFARQFSVEIQNALVKAVAAGVEIAGLLGIVEPEQSALPVSLGFIEPDVEVGAKAEGFRIFIIKRQ